MAHLLHLEEFETTNPSFLRDAEMIQSTVGTADNAAEFSRLAGYEQGYTAGWDDASVAAKEDQARISADFSHNLLDLSFTFHEAKSHVVNSLGPLLLAIVDKMLPELVVQSLGQKILEEILPIAELAANAPVQIVVAPANRASLEPLLAAADSTCPIELSEEPTLAVGQVILRSGQLEKQIDMDGAIARILEAISAVGLENQEAFANG